MENNNLQQQLVNDLYCEKIVLGTALSESGAVHDLREVLNEECFYDLRNRTIWRAIVNVVNNGDNPDAISVWGELNSMGENFQIDEILEMSSHYALTNLDKRALRLRELSTRRKLWEMAQKLNQAGVAESVSIEEITQEVVEGVQNLFGESEGISTLTEAFESLMDVILKNKANGTEITGTPTGFHFLDRKGGFQGSDLIIIAGETSQGKTAMALSITANAIQCDHKIAFYSMEMTKNQLSARILASWTGIPSNDILYNGSLHDNALNLIADVKSKIKGDNLLFDDRSTSNIDTIMISIRSMKIKYDISGAVVDYLQILNVNMKNTNKEQAMGDVSRRLKNLAKELGIWIIALSQLNRNSLDPVPNLNRLRDSGQIAEAADIVMFVYRPEYYGRQIPRHWTSVNPEGLAYIDVAKGRNIGVFDFLVRFDKPTASFSDIPDEEYSTFPTDGENGTNDDPLSNPETNIPQF